jgi:hypothetical protein
MTISIADHYRNCLCVQFGVAIAERPELWGAWDLSAENMDVQFDAWVKEFLSSEEDDSYAFFEGKIHAWIKELSSLDEPAHAHAVLSQTSVKPGDTVYAIVQDKKLNTLYRWITTKNLVVKPLRVLSITVEENAEETALYGYEESVHGTVFYTVQLVNCFISEAAANDELNARTHK